VAWAPLPEARRVCSANVDDERPNLREALARELAAAEASLTASEREALALRERRHLSHAQIGAALGLDEPSVAGLLARARLALRAARRGPQPTPVEPCQQREGALAMLARRLDGEALSEVDEAWLQEHLDSCLECEQAHAAMVEASLCYRTLGEEGAAHAGGAAGAGDAAGAAGEERGVGDERAGGGRAAGGEHAPGGIRAVGGEPKGPTPATEAGRDDQRPGTEAGRDDQPPGVEERPGPPAAAKGT